MRVDFLISSDGFGVLALDPHTSCIFNEILGGVLFAGLAVLWVVCSDRLTLLKTARNIEKRTDRRITLTKYTLCHP
jgi:hypothetical protein